MRRFLYIAVCLFLALSLCSCSNWFTGMSPAAKSASRFTFEDLQTLKETLEEESRELASASAAEWDGQFRWLPGGTTYHTRRDCSYIKNKTDVVVGTQEEAIAAGKLRCCSRCAKKDNIVNDEEEEETK